MSGIATPAEPELSAHYDLVVDEIVDGSVVPFLGAGANLCGRPNLDTEREWAPGGDYLPSGPELAGHLATRFRFPEEEVGDLVRVSQFAAVMRGTGPLYTALREIFDADYVITPLHRFLAELPGLLHEKGIDRGYQLIVTTNYDDVLERAFREAGEPFDLVSYMADGDHVGRCVHWPPDGPPAVITKPNEYRALSLDKRTAILKIHGAVDRADPGWDSYVITEDHFIDYLTHAEISSVIPVQLAAKLTRSHFLFLGYGLRDWNLRVILHRIWKTQQLTYQSWAVQLRPPKLEQRTWDKRGVEIQEVSLDTYIQALSERLGRYEPPAVAE